MAESPALLAHIAFTFLIAGLVKGVLGMGLPTVAVGLSSLVMPPAQAAALMVVPSLITNAWQMVAGPSLLLLWRRLWTMLLFICLGTWIGVGFLGASSSGLARLALGLALIVYAALGLIAVRLRVPVRAERWASPLTGLITGLVTAVTGVFVIPGLPYLQALDLDPDDLVQALGLYFTVSAVALLAALLAVGLYDGAVATTSMLALAPALLGMWLGQRLRRRASPRLFRLCFFLGMLGLGAHLAISGLI